MKCDGEQVAVYALLHLHTPNTQTRLLSPFLSLSLDTSSHWHCFFLMHIFSSPFVVPLRRGEAAHIDAGNKRHYRLLNKQKYVGHGQHGFVTK